MNSEIAPLQHLGERLDPPEDAPSADLRRRVMTGVLVSPRTRARFGWQVAIAGGLAAAVAAAVLLAPSGSAERPTGSQVMPGETRTPNVQNATQILLMAAQRSATEPALRVRPNQFVFVESVDRYRTFTADPKSTTPKQVDSAPYLAQQWISADGTRDGQSRARPLSGGSWQPGFIPGCKDGKATGAMDRPNKKVSCVPYPGYLGNLPTDPERMFAYLYRPNDGPNDVVVAPGSTADQTAFARVAYILYLSQTTPAVQAAVYQAATRIPGISVLPDAVDITGRHGMALVRTDGGVRDELIFSAETFRYLGMNRVYLKAPEMDPKSNWSWQVTTGQAILRVGVADRVGQLP